jgi:tRNA uridine 5-carboxymethylaminomethyl modification enzyme
VAGINAARLTRDETMWVPRRDEAYMGVLIDDLTTQGTLEPYRMFTSRAEYRLQLREDNADLRLTAQGRELGLVDDARWMIFNRKREAIEKERTRLSELWLTPENSAGKRAAAALGEPISKETRAIDLLKRPGMTYRRLAAVEDIGCGLSDDSWADQLQIQVRYSGYLDRQSQEIERRRKNETLEISTGLDYSAIKGLSAEVTEKLARVRPATVGQASRIPGVTPAAISLLLVHLKKRGSRAA